jgi:hypothetical protein
MLGLFVLAQARRSLSIDSQFSSKEGSTVLLHEEQLHGVEASVNDESTTFTESLHRLNDGHWEKGSINDDYFLPRERRIVNEQASAIRVLTRAGKGTMEEYRKKYTDNCCTKDTSKNSTERCGLYHHQDGCCIYQLRHACGAGNISAVAAKFTTSTGVSMVDIAKLLLFGQTKTLLFAGDSVSSQSFSAATCDLYRHGVAPSTPTGLNCADEKSSEGCCQNFQLAPHDSEAQDSSTAYSNTLPAGRGGGRLRLCFLWMPEYDDARLRGALSSIKPDVLVINFGLWCVWCDTLWVCTRRTRGHVR